MMRLKMDLALAVVCGFWLGVQFTLWRLGFKR